MMKRFFAIALAAALAVVTALPAAAQFADQATWAGTGAGSANAQTMTLPNATSLADLVGVIVKYVPNVGNTGDATLTVNSFVGSPPHFRKPTGSGLAALTGAELVAGQPVWIMYDGTYFDLLSAYNGIGQAHVIYANAVSGVDPTGATDSATAINGIITGSACSGGCTIYFCGSYKINATISLSQGVRLVGCGMPQQAWVAAASPTYFVYNGSGASTMFLVNGLLQGWGIENMMIDGAFTAANCVKNVSGTMGVMKNVALRYCTFGYYSTTASSGGVGVTNANNLIEHISISVPSSGEGIVLTGYNNLFANGDTCCQTFNQISVVLASGSNVCIELGVADSNIITGFTCLINPTTGTGILWNYPVGIGYLPANNTFYGAIVSSGSGGSTTRTQFQVGSTPTGGATMHNWVDRPSLTNGDTWSTIAGVSIVNSP